MSAREISSLGMSFRRWSFSGNDDSDSSQLSPTSTMRFSYSTDSRLRNSSLDGTVETSLQSEAEIFQSRFLRVENLSCDLTIENVQALFGEYTNLKAINISNLHSDQLVILAFYTYSDSHEALVDLHESNFSARFCTETEIKETTDAKRYINAATSGKLSVRLHKEAQRPVLDLLETIGKVAKYQQILLPNDQVLLQIEYDDTRHAIEADKALGQSRYDVEKTWNHSVLDAVLARNKGVRFKEHKLQPFSRGKSMLNVQTYPPIVDSRPVSSAANLLQSTTTLQSSNEPTKKHSNQKGTIPERNKIDLDRIERGEDTRTTVMIKNIPNRLTTEQLEKYISDIVPRSFDFLYLRMDFKSRSNVGYAFVNFLTVDALYEFASLRINYKWLVSRICLKPN
ncbi:hypothetical protein E3Q16_04007 [Wallemia mellicola]|uniref:Mei2-like C-terminal RNA recognition motif domain-containing protein n=1 Tax=Wallemia mellicola TaxID=1708541 RepID=A0AB38MRF0_9BASI|nr:hypothetical protein E3Q16_04007 [Wallemia mellicola]TIC12812.1 hypothetical protein E3Q13_04070 [Wallemia mellicola]TIC50752.1 hypothetical protein E3Q04_03991 [Wallemia mellicola]TIC61124.1 hypothetical protein E3Q02_04027 [Wallemia mellicola]